MRVRYRTCKCRVLFSTYRQLKRCLLRLKLPTDEKGLPDTSSPRASDGGFPSGGAVVEPFSPSALGCTAPVQRLASDTVGTVRVLTKASLQLARMNDHAALSCSGAKRSRLERRLLPGCGRAQRQQSHQFMLCLLCLNFPVHPATNVFAAEKDMSRVHHGTNHQGGYLLQSPSRHRLWCQFDLNSGRNNPFPTKRADTLLHDAEQELAAAFRSPLTQSERKLI
jgi:hypothetical protein